MEEASVGRWSRSTAIAAEIVLVAIVAVVTTLDAWWNESGTREADALTFVLVGVSIGAMVGRRRWPIASSLVCGGALTWWYVIGHHGEMLNLPTMVCLYTVAVAGERRRTIVVGLVAATWSGLLGYFGDAPAGAQGGAPVLEMVWPAVPLLLGEVVRGRRELLAEYAARARRAEADRDETARRRVEAERLRIAREFHDVVAHTVSAVNVQTALAVAAFNKQPDVARNALQQARTSGREALRELRATVALLRGGAPTGDPAPRLAHLPSLVETIAGSGIDASVCVDTDGRELPAVVELTVFRIVQEALTNVIRHANARHVAVSVAVTGDRLVADIVDDGRPTNGDSPNPGFGLLGMCERVTALEGRIEYGPSSPHGFRIHATIPLDAGSR